MFSGCSVKRIGVTSLVAKQIPLLMYAGEVTCATPGGQLFQVMLTTHDSQSTNVDKDNNLESNFEKQLSLCRWFYIMRNSKLYEFFTLRKVFSGYSCYKYESFTSYEAPTKQNSQWPNSYIVWLTFDGTVNVSDEANNGITLKIW